VPQKLLRVTAWTRTQDPLELRDRGVSGVGSGGVAHMIHSNPLIVSMTHDQSCQ